MDEEPERITAAAIWRRGVVYTVPRPARHHHVVALMTKNGVSAVEGFQGFVTDAGRFVNRIDGLAIAEAANQIIKKHPVYSELYSEDMW